MGAAMQSPTDNPFRELWEAGYHRLVPVTPPDAPITQVGAFARRMAAGEDPRGKAPGVRRDDGLWHGMNFVAMEARDTDLDVWNAWGASVGVKTGEGLIAVDIDTSDQKAAMAIYEMAAKHLGPAKVRFGNKPKHLLLYEAPPDLGYCWTSFSTDTEDKAKVEILAEGRQFVAHGVHPKTRRPYVWKEGLPRRDTLSRVTSEQVRAFLDAVASALPNAKTSTGEAAKQPPEQHLLKAPSWEALERAVEALPNTDALFPTRDDYLRVAYAIKAAAPDGYELPARDLFLDWCDRWQTERTDEHAENDPAIAVADWERAKPPYRVGYDFILERAPALFFEPVENDDDVDLDMFAANAQATQEKAPGLKILSDEEIQNRPDPEWLIRGLLPEAGFNILYGDPGTGKSFLALDMALHIATGHHDWHGEAIRNRHDGAVLYIAGEGEGGFKQRINAWKAKHMPPAHLIPRSRFGVIFAPIDFRSADDIGSLNEAVQASGYTRIALLVVDTLARATPGADENAAMDMGLFVRACDVLRDRTGASVLVIHHANKGGDLRGSSALIGAADSIFKFDRQHGHKAGTLYCQKLKDGSDNVQIAFTLDSVPLPGLSEIEEGAEVPTSLVPRRLTEQEARKTVCTPEMQEGILEAIRAAWDAGRPWTFSYQARGRCGPRIVARDFGVPADTAEQWLRAWTEGPDACLEMAVQDTKRHLQGLKVRGDDTWTGDILS